MSIDFKRNRTQSKYEELLGITVSTLNENKEMFVSHQLTSSESILLQNELKKDTLDYFFNAAISFAEGIDSIFRYRYSWATVKLYYSIFYSIRASMASNGYAILVNKGILRLKITQGSTPYGSNNKKFKSTHKGTINHYLDIFSGSDNLLTNNIDDNNVYEWMEDARDIVNYRNVGFNEPECLSIWEMFDNELKNGNLENLLEVIMNDDYNYCFQEEYGIVAIPLKRIQQTIEDLYNNNFTDLFQDDKKAFVNEILSGQSRGLDLW